MAGSAPPSRLAILGAGGRAGRALTARALARGSIVTAVVRDPTRHPTLRGEGVDVLAGDALNAEDVAAATASADAVVSAVTPFNSPPSSFDDFDTGFYRTVNANILAAADAHGIERLVVIGLFATLHLYDGRVVADDDRLFPAALRPFAAAHSRGLTRLEEHGAHLDWLVLAPPAGLSTNAATSGHYHLGTDVADPRYQDLPLSYADLATAALDQIERPTRHREHVAIYGH